MKEGLIRLTGEKDIFYDSIEKVYRLRVYCPHCGVAVESCLCYDTLDALLDDVVSYAPSMTCSYLHALLCHDDTDEVSEAIQVAGLKLDNEKLFLELSEQQLDPILKRLSIENKRNIIRKMNDVDDILDEYGIERYPAVMDLTEGQAKEVWKVLYDFHDDYDSDMPVGELCRT
jgi:hypothetical protein